MIAAAIRLDRLQEAIRVDRGAGYLPFMVVGTGGSVSTGAIDELDRLADIAASEDMWFHVDGAYGALAAVVPELHDLFNGMERADSLAVDPHKWLYAPLEAGCTLVRDAQTLPDAFSYTPVYYHFGRRGRPADQLLRDRAAKFTWFSRPEGLVGDPASRAAGLRADDRRRLPHRSSPLRCRRSNR